MTWRDFSGGFWRALGYRAARAVWGTAVFLFLIFCGLEVVALVGRFLKYAWTPN